MTKPNDGPSLLQARKSHLHHRHLHQDHKPGHSHTNHGPEIDLDEGHHTRSPQTQTHPQPTPQPRPQQRPLPAGTHPKREIGKRQDFDYTEVIHVTYAVVNVIDSAGSTIDVQTTLLTGPLTDLPDPVTVLANPGADLTPAPASNLDIPTETGLPLGDLLSSVFDDFVPPAPTDSPAAVDSSVPVADNSSSTIYPTDSSTSLDSDSVTSAPSTSSTLLPSVSGIYNSTASPFFTNSTNFRSLFANATTTSSGSTSTLSETTLTTDASDAASPWLTSVTDAPSPTDGNFGAGGDGGDAGAAGGAGATLTVSPTTTSSAAAPATTPPVPPATVGAAVGASIAGVAILVLIAMYLWRWRKQHPGSIKLLGGGRDGGVSGRRLSIFDGRPSGGGSGGMLERTLPFALPAAVGNKSRDQAEGAAAGSSAPETSERGFYRVSGKKLPSVLQNGGDGYTDPRESVMSGASSYYRDSVDFFSPAREGSSPRRLALGSPMRPESGVMVMRSGPGRTPVTEQNPFADPPPILTPPLERRETDPLGRSLISQDSSRGSGSRFTEDL